MASLNGRSRRIQLISESLSAIRAVWDRTLSIDLYGDEHVSWVSGSSRKSMSVMQMISAVDDIESGVGWRHVTRQLPPQDTPLLFWAEDWVPGSEWRLPLPVVAVAGPGPTRDGRLPVCYTADGATTFLLATHWCPLLPWIDAMLVRPVPIEDREV